MNKTVTRYPIYVISKGRHDCCLTARFLERDGVDYRVVIEPQEYDAYAQHIRPDRLLKLPFSNLGLGGIPARNWCWEHSIAAGHERHWILDDNISGIRRWNAGKRIPMESGPAFVACEDFIDRYDNIAIAGMNYLFFARGKAPPFNLNVHVYSCLCIRNDLPHRWRGRYNEDTDLCLQVLADGWCTVLFNAFLIVKAATMTMKGGNTAQLYKGDGRLKMARSLERVWPGVVSVGRRFKRPQHVVANNWAKFDTPLRLKKGVVIPGTPNEFGMKLKQVRTPKNDNLRGLIGGTDGKA